MNPVLVILSAGQSEYREDILRRISDRYRLVLVAPEPVTWEKPYIIDHEIVDAADTEGFIAAALRFSERYPVAGVYTYDEWCVEMAARIGETLGLAHCGLAATRLCRDKWATRRSLSAADVPSAASEAVRDAAEALDAARRIGFPVVVKPRGMSASFGVSLVSGPDAVAAAFERAGSVGLKRAWEHVDGVLVEEYLDGPEISVDSVSRGAETVPCVFARKLLGYPPYFEEIGHIVAAPERLALDADQVGAVVVGAHRALGIDDTVTHTELRLTGAGPRIVEVNGRAGGDLIPELGWLATGVDVCAAGADVAAGRAPDLAPTRDRVAGVRFFYADSPGVVERVGFDDALASAPWLHRLTWLARPGATVHPEPGRRYFARIGFAVVLAQSVEQCRERMESAAAAVRLELTGVSDG